MDPVIAVDIGGTTTRIARISESGCILSRTSIPTPAGGNSPRVIPEMLIQEISRFLSQEHPFPATGIGIAAAGPVDFRTGEIVNPPNLAFPRIPVTGPLGEAFGLPVYIVNDCHAGILGEACFGGAQGVDPSLYITLSTGIGGAYIEQGRLLLGKNGNSLEIGHLTVDDTYAMECGCGHAGHWEAYASGKHIPRFFARWTERHGIPDPGFIANRAEEIFSAARSGNAHACGFLEELGRINARAISDLVVAFDPAQVLFDGSVALRNGDLILPPIRNHADRFLPLPDIRLSPLNGLAPLLGAAVIAHGYDTPFGSFTRFC